MKLVSPDDKINKAKTLRFICRCHLELNQINEAGVAARDAEILDSKSLQTHFLLFRIGSKEGNTNAGILFYISKFIIASEYLKKMSEDEDFKWEYYALAGQYAYEVIINFSLILLGR